jgi:hypothetical protein
MRLEKIALAAVMVLATASPSFALRWICNAPEIDAAVGPSALAILVAVGFIAFNRARS